ncbi:hypothetical protein FisN_19Lh053 [Fistulifera solaris]|uniref:Isochorismatase-like domain-containing protein n=1 Tax=Fistulifera solaris TaxID=1519565 RepID=A0A1Z5JR17_FISSO|nr:hypothetical protein FisN_19Lh053 [Fistulifera solaris]|eukprot:GAX16473.1 hypothetical protein FisN_19Lh053 [Fistulifera solaris]
MSLSPKKAEAKQKGAASRKLLLERYQQRYSFSNHHQLPNVDENDDNTFDCIHPSSPCRNLHHVPLSDWSSGCLEEEETLTRPRLLSPAARAKVRQALQTQNQENERLALLVVDLQNDVLDETSGLLGPSDMTRRRTSLLRRIRELTQQTLQLGGVVYFIRSLYFSKGACCTMGTNGSEWHPEAAAMIELLSRHSRVYTMTKQWYSAFLETTLHAQLRQHHVTHVMVAGVSTPQSVAATVRSANHLGYVTTLTDATAQADAAQQPATYFSLALFCHGVLAPSVPIQGRPYSIQNKDSLMKDDEKKEDGKERQRKTRLTDTKPERLIFDGCVRLSGIGAGDSMLLPEVFEAEKADALLTVIVEVVRAKHRLHYEWTSDKASTFTAIFRPVQHHVEELINQTLDWGRVGLVKPTDSQEEKSVVTNASSSTEGTANLGYPQKGHPSSTSDDQNTAHELKDVYNQCYLPSDKVTRRINYVAVVALGEGRVIEFEPKNADECKYAPQHIYCHHNSLLLIGHKTLQNYSHMIKTRHCNHSAPRVHITLGSVSRLEAPIVGATKPAQDATAVKEGAILPLRVDPIDLLVVLRNSYLRKVVSLVFFFGFLSGYFRATKVSPEATCTAT